MRAVSLALGVVLLGGCSLGPQPPTSADEQFSVVIQNRTQTPVFVLAHEVPACGSSRMPVADTLVVGATPPPGVALAGAVTIKTPRGYTGVVTVIVSAGGASSVALGDTPEASLPPCQGAA